VTPDRGWLRVKLEDHPLAIAGWVRIHHLIMYSIAGPGPHPCSCHGQPVDWGDGLEVDHVNRDRKDNRAENLRIVCRVGNNQNRVIPSRRGAKR
jgi:hypothetical protein